MPVLPSDASIEIYWVVIALTLGLSAVFSGLSLGLMTLTVRELEEIIATSEDPKEVKNAKKILPVRKFDIRLLCALILSTTVVDIISTIIIEEAFLLDDELSTLELVHSTLITTFAVFFIGGLFPMALCTAQALPIGAFFAPAMYPLIYAFYPISIPIEYVFAPFLKEPEEDNVLPSNVNLKNTFATFSARSVKIVNAARPKANTSLSVKSVKGPSTKLAKSRRMSIAAANAPFVDSRVGDVMKPWPWSDCWTVAQDAILDEHILAKVKQTRQKCIPVTKSTNDTDVVAMLMVTDLIGVQAESRTPLGQLLDASAA